MPTRKVVIELDLDADPVSGVVDQRGTPTRFTGWTELGRLLAAESRSHGSGDENSASPDPPAPGREG